MYAIYLYNIPLRVSQYTLPQWRFSGYVPNYYNLRKSATHSPGAYKRYDIVFRDVEYYQSQLNHTNSQRLQYVARNIARNMLKTLLMYSAKIKQLHNFHHIN